MSPQGEIVAHVEGSKQQRHRSPRSSPLQLTPSSSSHTDEPAPLVLRRAGRFSSCTPAPPPARREFGTVLSPSQNDESATPRDTGIVSSVREGPFSIGSGPGGGGSSNMMVGGELLAVAESGDESSLTNQSRSIESSFMEGSPVSSRSEASKLTPCRAKHRDDAGMVKILVDDGGIMIDDFVPTTTVGKPTTAATNTRKKRRKHNVIGRRGDVSRSKPRDVCLAQSRSVFRYEYEWDQPGFFNEKKEGDDGDEGNDGPPAEEPGEDQTDVTHQVSPTNFKVEDECEGCSSQETLLKNRSSAPAQSARRQQDGGDEEQRVVGLLRPSRGINDEEENSVPIKHFEIVRAGAGGGGGDRTVVSTRRRRRGSVGPIGQNILFGRRTSNGTTNTSCFSGSGGDGSTSDGSSSSGRVRGFLGRWAANVWKGWSSSSSSSSSFSSDSYSKRRTSRSSEEYGGGNSSSWCEDMLFSSDGVSSSEDEGGGGGGDSKRSQRSLSLLSKELKYKRQQKAGKRQQQHRGKRRHTHHHLRQQQQQQRGRRHPHRKLNPWVMSARLRTYLLIEISAGLHTRAELTAADVVRGVKAHRSWSHRQHTTTTATTTATESEDVRKFANETLHAKSFDESTNEFCNIDVQQSNDLDDLFDPGEDCSVPALTYRDIRQVFSDGSGHPSIEVRRDVLIICLPPVTALILHDRVLILVTHDVNIEALITRLQPLSAAYHRIYHKIESWYSRQRQRETSMKGARPQQPRIANYGDDLEFKYRKTVDHRRYRRAETLPSPTTDNNVPTAPPPPPPPPPPYSQYILRTPPGADQQQDLPTTITTTTVPDGDATTLAATTTTNAAAADTTGTGSTGVGLLTVPKASQWGTRMLGAFRSTRGMTLANNNNTLAKNPTNNVNSNTRYMQQSVMSPSVVGDQLFGKSSKINKVTFESFDQQRFSRTSYTTPFKPLMRTTPICPKFIEFPFELASLEILISAAFEYLSEELGSLQNHIQRLVFKLETKYPSATTLDELHGLKQPVQMAAERITAFDKALDSLIANPDDLRRMSLTEHFLRPELYASSNAEIAADPKYRTINPNLEILLEFFDQEIDQLGKLVRALNRSIDNTERLVQLRLSLARNNLIYLDFVATVFGLAIAIGTSLSGIFGMNLASGIEDSPMAFFIVCGVIGSVAILGGLAVFMLSQRIGL